MERWDRLVVQLSADGLQGGAGTRAPGEVEVCAAALVPWSAPGEVSCGVESEALLWQGRGSGVQGLCAELWGLPSSVWEMRPPRGQPTPLHTGGQGGPGQCHTKVMWSPGFTRQAFP